MNHQTEVFDQIVQGRRSIRKFDMEHDMHPEVVAKALEHAILSANSSNMQLWEFYRIVSPEARAIMAPLCLGQNAAKTASELVVFVARPDLWKERQEKLVKHFLTLMPDKTERKAKLTYQYYEEWIPVLYNIRFPFFSDIKKHILIWKNRNKPFMKDVFSRDVPIICHKSVALAAQTFMLSIKAAGYDSCPMEGMDSKRIKAYLQLPLKAEISMVIGVGKGLPEGMYGKRFRIPNEEVIFTL